MSPTLRIALVLHPFALRPVGRDHAAALASELLGRGHVVQGFGTRSGRIPQAAKPEGLATFDPMRLADFEPDVLVAYDARSPAALLAARHARRLDRPLVLVEDGHGLSGSGIERLLRGVGLRLWGRLVRRRTVHVVALDPVARAEMERDGYDPRRITVLPPGLDLVQFRPGLASHLVARHGLRGRILLHVGPLEPGQGLEALLDAFAATVGQRSDWSLVLAGEGSAQAGLRASASRQGIGAQVRFLPFPRAEELPGLLGASTLLAAPSAEDIRYVRRAMACGVPVLAADLPRLRHLIEDDGAGLLAAPGDREAWTETLRRATQAPERRRRWGQRGRRIAEERFSWSRIAREIEGILLEAIAEGDAAVQALATPPASPE